ncbi:hypothetical protein CJU89_5143 [Yarrowia sp. B02]|nr:hypothetical protein CJU89_5143 [Yarrowia sp. B02]
MDTTQESDKQWDDLKETIQTEWQKCMESGDYIYTLVHRYCDILDIEQEGIKLDVPVPATKEDIASAVANLATQCRHITSRMKPIYESFIDRVKLQVASVKRFQLLLKPQEFEGAKQQYLVGILFGSADKLGKWEGLMKEVERNWDSTEDVLFQGGLQLIVKDQDAKTQKEFFAEYQSSFGGHIHEVVSTKPEVSFDDSASVAPETRFLPAEIISHIYAAADLETCVALREVSTRWYTVFQESECLLRAKLRRRNPWMKPGDPELKTWHDCVLVFVGRLRSGKWMTTDTLDKIKITKKNALRKTVVGMELGVDQKLPGDFVSIMDDCGCDIAACEHLHFREGQREYITDPWTHESRRYDDLYDDVSPQGDGSLRVLDFSGTQVTFPGWVLDSDESIADIHIGRSIVSVTFLDDDVVLFPRPLTDAGDFLLYRRQDSHYHFGDMYVARDACYFNVADMESKQLIRYATSLGCRPQAFYNGLLWWSHEESLVPTFLDLDNPHKVYYRTDRAISGYSRTSGFAQGSQARGSSHLVVSKHKYGQEIVDLSAGTITLVRCQQGWPAFAQHFIGYQNGKFQAWYMGPRVLRITRLGALTALDALEADEGEELGDFIF